MKLTFSNHLQHFIIVLLLFMTVISAGDYRNVYDEKLQTCSDSGMALTGYTRNGHCMALDGDHGSHHICINLSSTAGGNFCEVTGQPNWCSQTNMECHEDRSQRTCAIRNWCVCQWAFARYIERAGGCGQIQDIVCESINIEALLSYKKDQRYATALDCLVDRCKLNSTTPEPLEESSREHGEL